MRATVVRVLILNRIVGRRTFYNTQRIMRQMENKKIKIKTAAVKKRSVTGVVCARDGKNARVRLRGGRVLQQVMNRSVGRAKNRIKRRSFASSEARDRGRFII